MPSASRVPVEKKQKVGLAPKIGRRRGGRPKRKSAREHQKNPVILPTCSRKPLPPAGPCPNRLCSDDLCAVHCRNPRKNAKGEVTSYDHEVDLQFLGWAKGHGDGTFDVSCARCGEIGWAWFVPKPDAVEWG